MHQLVEKQEYLFHIVKKITLPDLVDYFVITDPFQNRHLLPVNYYLNYNLAIGTDFLGIVDKINCTGKIFIEPYHPLYKIGENYEFKSLTKDVFTDKKGNKHQVMYMTDNFESNAMLFLDSNEKIIENQIIICKIDRIKKAKLFLSLP